MKSTTKYFYLFWGLILSYTTFSQTRDKHLEPVGGIFSIYDYQFEYFSQVRQVLFDGLSDKPVIRFQVMPSFTPENVLVIEYDRDSNNYYIKFNICEKMIWYNKNWEHIKVKKYVKEIDSTSVALIYALFKKAVINTKYITEEDIGFDGETYYFSVFDRGIKSGEIWSPNRESPMGRLVEIGNGLISLTKSNAKYISIDKNFKNEIIKLTEELE